MNVVDKRRLQTIDLLSTLKKGIKFQKPELLVNAEIPVTNYIQKPSKIDKDQMLNVNPKKFIDLRGAHRTHILI